MSYDLLCFRRSWEILWISWQINRAIHYVELHSTLERFLRKKNHQQKKSSKIMGCLQNWMNGFWIVNTEGIENNCWKTGLDHIFTHLWCQEEEFVFQSKGKRKLLKGDDLFKVTFRMEQRKKDLLGTRHSARHSTARSLSLF